jgi:hypothetical protein
MLSCWISASAGRLFSAPISFLLGLGLFVSSSISAQSSDDDPFADPPSVSRPIDNVFSELSNAGDLLAEDEGMRRIAAQQMESQVRSELNTASKSRDPSATKLSLKALQDQIRRAPQLDAAGRIRLESQVGSAIQAAARSEINFKNDFYYLEKHVTWHF